MTTRRGFLGAMFAACAAPAIVKASSIMQINTGIVAPKLWTIETLPPLMSGEIGQIDRFRIVEDMFRDPRIHKELGELMGKELHMAANRKGFTRRFLDRQDRDAKKSDFQFIQPDYFKDFTVAKFPGQAWPR